MFCPLLSRSAGQRHPVSEEGVGAEVGGDYCGDRRPHHATEQSGESRGSLQRASESHRSLYGGEVRLEIELKERTLNNQ